MTLEEGSRSQPSGGLCEREATARHRHSPAGRIESRWKEGWKRESRHRGSGFPSIVGRNREIAMRLDRKSDITVRGFVLAGLLLLAGPAMLASAQSYDQLIQQYQSVLAKGQFSEALRLARLGVQAPEAARNQEEIAAWENEIGNNCIHLGRYDEAEAALKHAINIRIGLFGDDSDPVLVSRGNLAHLYHARERFDEAEAILRRSISIRERTLGLDSPVLAVDIANLGVLLHARGRYKDSEMVSKRALAIYERSYGTVHIRVAECLKTLGDSYIFQGRFDEAVKVHLRALRIREALLVAGHLDIGLSLNSLAGAYRKEGKFVHAVPLLKRSLGIAEKALGPDHSMTLTITSNIAEAYVEDARYAEAEALYKRAISGQRKGNAPLTRLLAVTLANYSTFLLRQGRFAEAEAGFREAIKAVEQTFGKDHPETAVACNQLSTVLLAESKLAEAETMANRALTTLEKAIGLNHPDTGFVYGNLADIAERTGNLDKSLALLTRCITNLERAGASPGHRSTSYHHRSAVFWQMGRRDEALTDLRTALDLAEQRRGLSAGTERDRAERYAISARAFERMVEWQATLGDANEAFRAVERFRARSFLDEMASVGVETHAVERTLTQDEQMDNLREGERLKAVMKFYEQHRAELLKTMGPSDFEVKSNDDQIAATRKEMDDLERRMNGTITGNRPVLPTASAAPPTPIEFLDKMGSDTLLLDYLFGEDGGYVVVVGPGATRVAPLVVAGPEAATLGVEPGPLTSRRLRDALIGAKGDGVVPRLAVASTSETVSAKLGALWRVLVPEDTRRSLLGGGVRSLIVAPDGPLALLPFETLVVEDGPEPKYLLDLGPPIAYAPSAAVLTGLSSRTDPPARDRREPVLTLGDPTYPIAKVDPPKNPSAELSPGYRFRASGMRLGRLPFTATETAWVSQAFSESGRLAFALSGSTATEAAVRLNVPGRRFIHLACHGLTDQAYGNVIGALALTPGPQPDAEPADDGFLTLPEVYALDLKGCELAILSACETNIGPQQRGEGSWTLSRGFLVAGARRVVASDWLVDDEAAANLMSIFCNLLTRVEKDDSKADYAKALQEAKRWARRQERWKAPYYWASLVLVGPPRNLAASPANRPPGRNGEGPKISPVVN
jgi:CHAT domain-containing protein/tetratricopeptide (TPR) repeat protein